jgi:hypothetical protein
MPLIHYSDKKRPSFFALPDRRAAGEVLEDKCNTKITTIELKGIQLNVRFEDFTAVTMNNGVFWDVTSCGSCKNRRFRGT